MPAEIRIEKEGQIIVYKQALFLLHTRDEEGNCRLLTNIPMDHEMSLSGGEEFVTGYLFDRIEEL